jgi:hypothetical protein
MMHQLTHISSGLSVAAVLGVFCFISGSCSREQPAAAESLPGNSTVTEQFIFATRGGEGPGLLWSVGLGTQALRVHSVVRADSKSASADAVTRVYITFVPLPPEDESTRADDTVSQQKSTPTGNDQAAVTQFARLSFDANGAPTSPHTLIEWREQDRSGEVRIYIPTTESQSAQKPLTWRLATTLPAPGADPLKAIHWLNATAVLEAESMGGSSRVEFSDISKHSDKPRQVGKLEAREVPGMIGITAITPVKIVTPYRADASVELIVGNRTKPLVFNTP